MGFNQKVNSKDLESTLNDGDRAKELLNFVEVKENDYFEIAPGVVHAIGPGVTLLEPQRILKGKSGKTLDFGTGAVSIILPGILTQCTACRKSSYQTKPAANQLQRSHWH